jgi:hypothetical protein
MPHSDPAAASATPLGPLRPRIAPLWSCSPFSPAAAELLSLSPFSPFSPAAAEFILSLLSRRGALPPTRAPCLRASLIQSVTADYTARVLKKRDNYRDKVPRYYDPHRATPQAASQSSIRARRVRRPDRLDQLSWNAHVMIRVTHPPYLFTRMPHSARIRARWHPSPCRAGRGARTISPLLFWAARRRARAGPGRAHSLPWMKTYLLPRFSTATQSRATRHMACI